MARDGSHFLKVLKSWLLGSEPEPRTTLGSQLPWLLSLQHLTASSCASAPLLLMSA